MKITRRYNTTNVECVRLVGGTRDGEMWDVYSYQPHVYLRKRQSLEDDIALEIDAAISWKTPEEVYERQPDGSFHYQRTVHYKPDDVTNNINENK